MQDEFFKKDRNHQEAMDKKREERNEAIRELGERVAHLPLLLCFGSLRPVPERVAHKEQERTSSQYNRISKTAAAQPLVARLGEADAQLQGAQTESKRKLQVKPRLTATALAPRGSHDSHVFFVSRGAGAVPGRT